MPRQRGGAGARRTSTSAGLCASRNPLSFWPVVGRAPAPVSPSSSTPTVASPPSSGGGLMSSVASNVVGGMASGVGFGVAQRAVDAVMGARTVEVVHSSQPGVQTPAADVSSAGASVQASPCTAYQEALQKCLATNSDIASCQHFLDDLKSCQMSFGRL